MQLDLVVMVGDQFAFDRVQGLVGRKALCGNIIINFPYPTYLYFAITSSWAAALVFPLTNLYSQGFGIRNDGKY